MVPCRKCGCKEYSWNFVSSVQKFVSGGKFSGYGISYQAQEIMDNTSDQAAYRNCLCGHHKNYH